MLPQWSDISPADARCQRRQSLPPARQAVGYIPARREMNKRPSAQPGQLRLIEKLSVQVRDLASVARELTYKIASSSGD
jgi:hypothetical protein